ncbi:hypothetical protein BgAZ_501460 [Babesia gibsoni]|uniref:Macro domain-containing protein n=1 Tax=Babesia gibsoni TaxID=33632 RepID=A0AAD8PCS6_BABGI|nr:hypothetical protein BgAZ_501460 [Babesia gibsoni]
MTEHIATEFADTLFWIVGEIGNILDVDINEVGPSQKVLELKKVPQSSMEPWTTFNSIHKLEATSSNSPPKFKVNNELNNKVFIGVCDILEIEVGVITIFLDEISPASSKIVRRIQIQSGKDMPYDEFDRLRCGEVLMQKCYNIGSEYVIYAISPRFSAKYPDASANIINTCVRETFKAAISANIGTIVFPLKMGKELQYPNVEFAIAVLRGVRRWLERPEVGQNIERVFFFGLDENSYSLMRRFFPRNKLEEKLSGEIAEAGNEFGEIVKVERNIRISAGISADSEDKDEAEKGQRNNFCAPLANFTDNCRFGIDKQISQKDSSFAYFNKLSLSIMSLPVYRQMDDSGFVTRHARDVAHRPVVAIDLQKMPEDLNHTYAIAYILRMMQPVIQASFAMVLLNMDHGIIAASSLCNLVTQVFQVLGYKRLRNLGVLYIHRSGWTVRGLLYVLTSLLTDLVQDSIVYVDTDENLAKYIDLRRSKTIG